MRAASLLTVLLLAATTIGLGPAAQGSETQAVLDLGATVPTGEFRAHRVRLFEAAAMEFGGTYQGVTTVQPVLPILGAVERLDAGCAEGCASALFSYDFTMETRPLSVVADVHQGPFDHHHGAYSIAGGGWFTTAVLEPGEYLLLAASAPAESGTATLRLRVLGAAEALASQAGASSWARGYDLSATKYDVHAIGARGVHARAWSYSGGEASLEATGRMFGYLGYHDQGGAHWEGPSPSRFGFIQDGLPGTYKAVFPAEEFQGPLCGPLLGCNLLGFGDTREDPPFAIAADISV